jgi:hypothetical protein
MRFIACLAIVLSLSGCAKPKAKVAECKGGQCKLLAK